MKTDYDFEYALTDDEQVEAIDRGEICDEVNHDTGHHIDCICSLCVGI